MKNHKLQCEYCGALITEKDNTCPNCGANCSKVIKDYYEEMDKEREQQIEKSKEIIEDTVKSFKKMSTIPVGIFIFIFAVAFIIIVFTMTQMFSFKNDIDNNPINLFNDDNKNEPSKVAVGFNEKAVLDDYTVILDSYEEYNHNSNNFPEVYNTKNGYQKIAFHFIIENTSSKDITFGGSDLNISLKADNYKVEDAELEICTFCYAAKGQEKYPELGYEVLNSGDTLQGYVGYVVPKNTKTLKFKVGKFITITMDNPSYEE